MYLCFEESEKRSAFPELSLSSMDENGFTFKSSQGNRKFLFIKLDAYQGTVQSFGQALQWVKRAQPKRPKPTEPLPSQPRF